MLSQIGLASATGEEEGREGILDAGLAAHLPSLLLTEGDEVRLAAVWAVINLTSFGEECPGATKRVAILQEAGVSAVRPLRMVIKFTLYNNNKYIEVHRIRNQIVDSFSPNAQASTYN